MASEYDAISKLYLENEDMTTVYKMTATQKFLETNFSSIIKEQFEKEPLTNKSKMTIAINNWIQSGTNEEHKKVVVSVSQLKSFLMRNNLWKPDPSLAPNTTK
jgi:hypothetical protein